MKSLILILLCAFTVFGTQAQSQRKINEQLKTELRNVQRIADSIEIIQADRRREIKNLRYALEELNLQMSRQMYEEDSYRSGILREHAVVSEFGFDANTIISLPELNALSSPVKGKQFGDWSVWENRPFVAIQKPEMRDLTDLKIKFQNEILLTKIAEYKDVNAKNKELLKADDAFISELKVLRTDYIVSLEVYKLFNKDLFQKLLALSSKREELARIKREEENLKWQKELDVASKKKKNSKAQDDEPLLMIETVDSRGWEDIQVSDDSFYAVPPPPPPPPPPPAPERAPEVLELVEEAAEFPGGRKAMTDYLAKNMKMPQTAIEMGIQGKVYVKFVVSANGSISDIVVKKGIADCPECDAEAVRLVKEMPNWTPGRNNGKAVKSYYNLPVAFKTN